ncbi:outer membrane receptor protein involved in Fe transport [Bradyrhizobium diazoefficiens]
MSFPSVLLLAISAFDLVRQNVATTLPGSVPVLQNQTGEVTSRGIELEAVANATKELKLIGAFTAYHSGARYCGNNTLSRQAPLPSMLMAIFASSSTSDLG